MESLFIDRLQSSNPLNNTKYQQQNKLFGIGGEDVTNFSLAQPTYSAVMLISQTHVPYKWGTV